MSSRALMQPRAFNLRCYPIDPQQIMTPGYESQNIMLTIKEKQQWREILVKEMEYYQRENRDDKV